MEFESSAAVAKSTKKKKKKSKKKKSKGKNMSQDSSMTSNAEELAAFLYHLRMDEEDDEYLATNSAWATDNEKEKVMSANYIKSLATHENVLEAEFLKQFRTHLAWKQYLSGTEAKVFKDRIFLLMAKEQEAAQSGDKAKRILCEHYLYEELRLQHQYLTSPQVTDTANDIAFKVTMVPVVCGLIRNCNESRDTACLDIKGDDDECEALYRASISSRGSCLTSILRPLFHHLRARHNETKGQNNAQCSNKDSADKDSDIEGMDVESNMELVNILSPDLQVLCCGGGRENRSSQQSDKFFEGPPEWHRNLPFFMKRIQYSNPTPERTGYVKHALRKVQALRVMQEQQQFYDIAYGNACAHTTLDIVEEMKESRYDERRDFTTLELPFNTHVMLHRSCHAVITLKPSATLPPDSEVMTLSGFKRLVTVQLPRLLVTPCSRCHVPCTGECVCGRSYCSASCLTADQCSGCQDGCCDELLYLTPIAWGRAPLKAS
jgi:hypothetical protein